MDTQPGYAIQTVIASIVGQVAEAVSERPGESQQRQGDRKQAAVGAIMAFRPGDPVEAILSGHCVMFHEMIVADVHHALCGEAKPTQRATGSGIVAMDKAFGANLIRLKQHRAAKKQETQPSDDRIEPEIAEMEIADRVRRHLAKIEPKPREAATTVADREQSEADAPTETWPTALQTLGLNRQARRALDRQIRKRASGQPIPGITPDRNAATTTPSATAAG